MKEIKSLPKYKQLQLVQKIKDEIRSLQTDVAERNNYVEEMNNILFDSKYIISDISVPKGHDLTKFNFLRRAWEIHSAQAGGRGFSVFARFNKQDLSDLEEGTPEYEEALIKNEAEQERASIRRSVAQAIIDDNGGRGFTKKIADIAGAYGFCVVKGWLDENGIYRLTTLEKPKNYVAGWSSDNFKERDFDACIYQMSYSKAKRVYGEYLDSGDDFIIASGDGNTSDPINMLKDEDNESLRKTSRKMVTVLDFTGYLNGIEEIMPQMKDKPFNVLIVGNRIVAFRKERLPKYYLFINREIPGKAYGESDITFEAVDINKTYIQTMSRYLAILDRGTFPLLKAKGFKPTNLPSLKAGSSSIIPMSNEQDISAVTMQVTTYPYDRVLDELKESLFRVLGLGRVLIDDPTVSYESSQALMIGMKSTIDIAEDKQSRWEGIIVDMLNDALIELSKTNKELKEAIGPSGDPQIYIKWPSILRKEDASYRTMWLNDFTRGAISLPTYMEQIGIDDVQEEMDRIRDVLKDPVLGAVAAGNMREINSVEIQKEQMGLVGELPAGSGPTNGAGPQPNPAMLTPEQNRESALPMSQRGSGAPFVPKEELQEMINQNRGL
jgi:hypothetical protein